MKVIQTENQIQLKSDSAGQFILGLILIPVGIGMASTLHGAVGSDGKKAPAWAMLIGIVVLVAGVLMMIFAKNRSVTIQKGGDTTVRAKRILFGQPEQQTIPTANIVAVRLSTYVDRTGNTTGGNPSNSRRSVLSLVLNNNDLVEVGGSGGGGLSVNGLNVSSLILKAPLSKEANQVAGFLGVPLQADDTSSFAGAVKSVKAAFEQDSPGQVQSNQPVQPTSFNPNPAAPAQPQPAVPSQTPPPQPSSPAPTPPVPPAPQPPVSPSPQVPPAPPAEGGPPPPYTPPSSGPAPQ